MRRKVCIALLLLICLMLTACSGEEQPLREALDFREVLKQHGGCSFRASVTSEIDGRFYSFSLDAVYRSEGDTSLKVTAPEELAGIEASMRDRNANIRFEETELTFGVPDETLTSPLYAPLIFGQCWERAYIDSAANADGQYDAIYCLGYGDEELILECRFEGGIPASCELYRKQTMLLSATLENFHFLTDRDIE